jgi:type IV secretion system protein TrbB
VSTIPFRTEAYARGARMLRTALGPTIASYLEDPAVAEVMLNPDGRLWIDRLAGGPENTGFRIAAADAERIVRLVAHHVGVEVHAGSPRVSAELPESGERFEGLVPRSPRPHASPSDARPSRCSPSTTMSRRGS